MLLKINIMKQNEVVDTSKIINNKVTLSESSNSKAEIVFLIKNIVRLKLIMDIPIGKYYSLKKIIKKYSMNYS